MTTLDKINAELATMQEGLSHLNSYTDEIGKAKEASVNVVKYSKEFLSSFQKRIETVSGELQKATDAFNKNCKDVFTTISSSHNTFQNGVSDAKKKLIDAGSELSLVAQNVNLLVKKINDINVLGHFEKAHATLADLKVDLNDNYKNITEKFDVFSATIVKAQKRYNSILIVLVVTVTVSLILTGFLLYKIF